MLSKIKFSLLAIGMTACNLSAAPLQAQFLPAVSNMNGWVGVSAGNFTIDNNTSNENNDGGVIIVGEGGFAAPLGDHYGFQLDGWDGVVAHHNYQSVEGFVFWRNPCLGLLGPHINYINTNHLYLTMYGLFGEAYYNDWTISADADVVSKNRSGKTLFTQAMIHWYQNANLRYGAGYGRTKANGTFIIDAEYMPGSLSSFPGLSFFLNAGCGNHDLRFAFFGIRYYFGSDPIPLINRHREDMVPPQLNLIMSEQN